MTDLEEVDGGDFGWALSWIRAGDRVSRAGWNGVGMFLFLSDDVPGYAPFISINTGKEVRPWLASQADLLSDDWTITT